MTSQLVIFRFFFFFFRPPTLNVKKTLRTVPPAVKVTNERVQVRLARVHRWVRSRSVRVHR